MIITDTHTHLYSEAFENDRTEMIHRAINANVKRFFVPAIDSVYTNAMFQLEKDFPNHVFLMMGLHPTHVKENYKDELAEINKKLITKFRSRFSKGGEKEPPLQEHQSAVGGGKVVLSTEVDVKMEVQREAHFLNSALTNSRNVLEKLEELDVRVERPQDFYAEMFKSDVHMEKVATRLQREKKRIENFETKKKQKQNLKFHKKLKHKRRLEAAKEKREGLKAIEKWKQKIRKGDTNAELTFKQAGKASNHSFVNQKNRKRGKGKRLGKSRRIVKNKRK